MMPMNSFKRKGRLSANSTKAGKSKFYPEKIVLNDGIYGNSKLMYTAASLVGCVVQIQVQSGAVFEGVLRTFSHQLDVVLEMAHKVESRGVSEKGISPIVSNLIASYPFEGGLFDKLIFKLSDIILMVASTVDMDYAVKDNFTDTAITKFNGQVTERELEPWEDAESDSEIGLCIEDEEGTNGWDANDMFRTNAEKYGVTSSYDNSLQDYTVPLLKKDTEEYKLQEERALRIAREIETNNTYQARIQLEDGDEEDRFSAVLRPTDDDPLKYVLPQKRRNNVGGPKRPPSTSKVYLASSCTQPLLSAPEETLNIVTTATVPKTGDAPVVRESSKSPLECPNSESSPPVQSVPSKLPPIYSTQTLPPRIERRRESEKKFSKHKGRTDEIEEFKKFSTNFKLTDEKECTSEPKVECLASKIERTQISDTNEDVVKYSTLNPLAKEFVFNPNAKSFTPRSMSVVTPPSVQEPLLPQMIPQPVFTAMAPQYVMQGAAPFATAPRFRKNTGSGIPTPSQLTVQYTQPPGVLHASQPAQPTVGYPQMNFVVGPRVMSPHSVTYCDTPHLPTHLIMSAHPPHTAANNPHTQGSNNLHPSPSPVHTQPPTPTTVVYPGQHPLQAGHHPMHHHHHHHHGGYPPQPLVLMQQQQGMHMLPQMAIHHLPTSAASNTPFMQQHP